MKIWIQGPGAVGMFLAARLAAAGADVRLLDRDPERATRLSRDGVWLGRQGEDGDRFPVVAVAQSEAAEPGDLLIVCVKAYDVEEAVSQGMRHLHDRGQVLLLANGLGNLEAAQKSCPSSRLYGGTVSFGVLREAENRVRIGGDGVICVGRATPGDLGEESTELLEALESSGVVVETTDDLPRQVWRKAAINCGINPVTALLGIRNGDLPESPAFAVSVAASREAGEVARKSGSPSGIEEWGTPLREVCAGTAGNRSSMLADLEAGRRTEIDALCGAVVERGRACGVSTPTNRVLRELVRAREALVSVKTSDGKGPGPGVPGRKGT